MACFDSYTGHIVPCSDLSEVLNIVQAIEADKASLANTSHTISEQLSSMQTMPKGHMAMLAVGEEVRGIKAKKQKLNKLLDELDSNAALLESLIGEEGVRTLRAELHGISIPSNPASLFVRLAIHLSITSNPASLFVRLAIHLSITACYFLYKIPAIFYFYVG